MTRRLGRLALAVVILVAGWRLLSAMTGDEGARHHRLERGELVLGVEVTGTLRAVETLEVGPPSRVDSWNFKISMMAPEGSRVEAGQPLLAFDTTEFRDRLERVRSEMEEAGRQLERKRAELDLRQAEEELRVAEAEAARRRARLGLEAPRDLVGRLERQAAQLDFDLAETRLAESRLRLEALDRARTEEITTLENRFERARSRVEELEGWIRQMQVAAPRSGTVIYVRNWRGEKKKVGDDCWRFDSVIELPDLDRMEAHGEVDEVDSGRLAVGQVVRLRLDAHPDLEYEGRIRRVARRVQPPSDEPRLRVVRVEIDLDETDAETMRPGMRFRGEVVSEQIEDVVLLPLEAVRVMADGPVVQRKGWAGVQMTPVRLGRRNDEFVEVLEGVEAGDVVLWTADAREAS